MTLSLYPFPPHMYGCLVVCRTTATVCFHLALFSTSLSPVRVRVSVLWPCVFVWGWCCMPQFEHAAPLARKQCMRNVNVNVALCSERSDGDPAEEPVLFCSGCGKTNC